VGGLARSPCGGRRRPRRSGSPRRSSRSRSRRPSRPAARAGSRGSAATYRWPGRTRPRSPVGCIYSDQTLHLPIWPKKGRLPRGPDGPFRDALAPGLPGGKDLSHSSFSASELAGQSKKHQCHSSPTMFTKQVSWAVDGLGSPIVAAEAEQVERTRSKTWSRARSEVFVPYRYKSWSTPGSLGASATVRGAGASRGSWTRSGGPARG